MIAILSNLFNLKRHKQYTYLTYESLIFQATAVSPSLGACVCHSFTEAFLSLYSQAYLFCDENGGSRQERLFKIPDKIFEIGFASLTGKNGIGFATGFFLGKPEAGGLGLSAFEGSGDDEGGDD